MSTAKELLQLQLAVAASDAHHQHEEAMRESDARRLAEGQFAAARVSLKILGQEIPAECWERTEVGTEMKASLGEVSFLVRPSQFYDPIKGTRPLWDLFIIRNIDPKQRAYRITSLVDLGAYLRAWKLDPESQINQLLEECGG